MKIIVHVGMGKTGTTSLQRVLARSRGRLRDKGVIYPDFFGETAHAGLCLTCMEPGDWRFPRGYRSLSKAERQERVSRVYEALDTAAREHPRVLLLSSEYIYYLDEKNQTQLIGELKKISNSVQAAAWLRHPIDYYFSASKQRAKSIGGVPGSSPRPPEKFSVDLELSVERLKSVWGNVLLRPYESKLMKNGDIVPDFFYHLLREYVDFTPPSIRENVGGNEERQLWQEDREDIIQRLRSSNERDIRFYESLFTSV